MASGCKAAVGCVDTRVPVRASYVNLYKWPESDAEFVKSVAARRRRGGGADQLDHDSSDGAGNGSARRDQYSPRVVDSYSCRQMYLRSYTFSKEPETVPEKTMRCFGRVKERAAVFPFLPQRSTSTATETSSVSSSSKVGGHSDRRTGDAGSSSRRRRRRKKKKECAMVKRLREASYYAISTIFHRLLACAASVEVADGGPPGPSGWSKN